MAYVIGPAVFIGDAAYFMTNGRANLPPLPLTADNNAARVSLRRLAERLSSDFPGVSVVIPGHSGEGTVEALFEYSTKNKQ